MADLRKCPRCPEPKPVSEFNWRSKAKGRLQSLCRDHQRQRNLVHYRDHPGSYKRRAVTHRRTLRQQYTNWLFQHPCVDCGEGDPVVLDADHVRGEKKRGGISRMLKCGCSWQAVLKELEKCEVRCANCHRRKTSRERDWKSRIQYVDLGVSASG